jgi:CubicO group peptidase (beta-lactamase class C family)
MQKLYRLTGLVLAACLALQAGPALDASAAPVEAVAPGTAGFDQPAVATLVERARGLGQLNAIIVSRHGETVLAERLRGAALDQPVNIKSVSKSIVSALVGRAIAEGLLEGVDQKISPLLAEAAPDDADPRLADITIGHLLSMQSGLERTSGGNYGRWVASDDWVRFALSRSFVDEPGGGMLYSTGNTHLLSAILTKVSGHSTRALFEDWIAAPLGIEIGEWERDPHGIYLGGNNMALSPRDLLAFGEMIRQGGRVGDAQLVPAEWIQNSWTPRTRSIYSGEQYGLGWFITEMAGHPVYYGWGYGGQMLYVVPDLGLTVVMTSDPEMPAGRTGYVDELHRLMAEEIIPAAEGASG